MTKVEKLVQQRVNPQKLQNFQSSRNMKRKNGVKQAFFGFLLFIINWSFSALQLFDCFQLLQ